MKIRSRWSSSCLQLFQVAKLLVTFLSEIILITLIDTGIWIERALLPRQISTFEETFHVHRLNIIRTVNATTILITFIFVPFPSLLLQFFPFHDTQWSFGSMLSTEPKEPILIIINIYYHCYLFESLSQSCSYDHCYYHSVNPELTLRKTKTKMKMKMRMKITTRMYETLKHANEMQRR